MKSALLRYPELFAVISSQIADAFIDDEVYLYEFT